ncbi:hypothetical protein DPSP01_007213 [Paraphaeosphaeria sporulosa]
MTIRQGRAKIAPKNRSLHGSIELHNIKPFYGSFKWCIRLVNHFTTCKLYSLEEFRSGSAQYLNSQHHPRTPPDHPCHRASTRRTSPLTVANTRTVRLGPPPPSF